MGGKIHDLDKGPTSRLWRAATGSVADLSVRIHQIIQVLVFYLPAG
jgi:hypothetical protein